MGLVDYTPLESSLTAGSELLRDYGPLPLVNQLPVREGHELRCGLTLRQHPDLRLLHVHEQVLPQTLFPDDYAYRSSTSQSLLDRMSRLVEQLSVRHGLKVGDLTVELASNDGYLLRWYAAIGMRCVGVEPAAELARDSEQYGIQAYAEFFTPELAGRLRQDHGPAKIVHAHNVLAHVPDPEAFLRSAADLLDSGGSLYVEVPWVVPLLRDALLDTVYHEHLYYFSAQALAHLGQQVGLRLVDADVLPDVHGGSARFRFTKHAELSRSRILLTMLETEATNWDRLVGEFPRLAELRLARVRHVIEAFRASGRAVAAYGASAKAAVLLDQLDLGHETVQMVGDISAAKQGRWLNGRIPIVPPEAIWYQPRACDLLVCTAWNLADELQSQLRSYTQQHGQVLFPTLTPELRG